MAIVSANDGHAAPVGHFDAFGEGFERGHGMLLLLLLLVEVVRVENVAGNLVTRNQCPAVVAAEESRCTTRIIVAAVDGKTPAQGAGCMFERQRWNGKIRSWTRHQECLGAG
jgi:hypothetical protein